MHEYNIARMCVLGLIWAFGNVQRYESLAVVKKKCIFEDFIVNY